MPHGVAVYREGSATLTPAPPAHAVQPSTVIHQLTGGGGSNKQDITLPNTPVSVQFSRAIVSGMCDRRTIALHECVTVPPFFISKMVVILG